MDLSRITRRIDGFRRQIRRLYLVSGVSRMVIAVVGLLLLSFLLDYLLRLPMAVRIASFAIALLATVFAAWKFVARPVTRKLPDEDLALAAEARIPELNDRLISALQFRDQMDNPDNAESRPMMQAVIEETGRLENALTARRVLDSGKVRRHWLLASASMAALCLLVLAAPAAAGVWARRNLLLADEKWPRSTELVVRNLPQGRPHVLTRGESLTVEVTAEGSVPDEVEIFSVRESDWDGYLDREVDPVVARMSRVEEGGRLFRFEFRQIPESFRFWVAGGDDDDDEPRYRIEALIPPTIDRIEARCEFPLFTGMAPETFVEGDLELPVGTTMDLTITANLPIASAHFAVVDGESKAMERRGESTVGFLLTVEKSLTYTIRLTGDRGQKNLLEDARFRIRAVPDKKPEARVTHPVSRPWHTLDAVVPIKVTASDNYGVLKTTLRFRKSSQEEYIGRDFGAGETWSSPREGAKDVHKVVGYAAIPVTELTASEDQPVRVGEEITFLAEAEDNNGNLDRSDRYRIEVVRAEELERRLSQQQTALRRDALKILREKQKPAYDQTEALLEFLRTGGTEADVDREALREIVVLQGAVTRETKRLFDAVASVFNTYVYNRLTNPPATERILVLLDEYLRNDRGDAVPVFKPAIYLKLIEEHREGRIRDQRTLGVLLEILDVTLKVAKVSSPRAKALLDSLASGESELTVTETLLGLRDLQRDILADLRLLDLKMQQWETYAEIIEIVRDILNTQEGVRGGAEGLGGNK